MSHAGDTPDMRELDCDFCGAAAAGAYEVVPAELDPSPDEQVRVVLCADCRGTLDGVLDPLLGRLGADGATGGATDGGPDAATRDATPETAPGPGTGRDDYDAQADARSGEPDSPSDDAVIIDASRRGAGSDSDGDAGSDAAADETAEDGSTDDGDAADDEPEGFRKVMRLLGNREFPVARAEVVDLADSAYDIDASEADAIIDYAVENDVLEEGNGQLHKA